MKHGHFIWADLSTYQLGRAQKDYARLFGWSFVGAKDYRFAMLDGAPVAAVFKMPKRLAKINMPSFWMSYIKVDDLDASVAQAREFENVIIEVKPEPFDETARIALVRDPSGAGFTLYEGPDIANQSNVKSAGVVVERYHHVPDISLIEPFYNRLFGWSFHQTEYTHWPVFEVRHPDGNTIAKAEQVPEEIRGKFRYWIPSFSIPSKRKFLDALAHARGMVHTDLGERRFLVADRQQAHFMIQF